MDNEKVKVPWIKSHMPTKRRFIQLYSALLYNAYLKGFVKGEIYTGKTKGICVPGFNCYSCPGAVGACPLGSIQAALAASDKRIGFYMIGIILLYGLIFGRTICGWLCPLGLIQELLHKLPTPKIQKSRITRALSYLKYVIIAVFVVAVPVWYGFRHGMAVPGFCKYICPAGTFEGAMGLLSNKNNADFLSMLNILFTRKFVIMLIIGLACVFCYRSFCRFLCPLGAIYGMFSRLAVIGVKVDLNTCNGCGSCVRACKMDVRHVGDHECIHCAQCIAVCPQGAISMKAGNKVLIASEKGDTKELREKKKKTAGIAWGIALAVLCIALLWFNVLDPAGKKKERAEKKTETVEQTQKEGSAVTDIPALEEEIRTEEKETSAKDADITETEADANNPQEEVSDEGTGEEAAAGYESDAQTGYEEGQQLEDFSIECIDGTTFSLREYRGKPVFINLWATYCGPCVQELPHFNDLYHEHEGDVGLLAVHSSLVVEDVGDYLSEKDWDIPFTVDSEDDYIFGITNGSQTLPQTIVLNRKGEVIYNKVGSVTPELLEKLYEQASKEP